MTRDRDPAGRARNARPRDALGRPLDRGGGTGAARVPDDLVLSGPEAARLADQLLRAGRPFHAHEVLEASWKSGPPAERDLWQGLAQIAVGLTHAHRGNARGAVTLLRRGAQRVRAYRGQGGLAPGSDNPYWDHPYGIDVADFLAASDDLAARIERDGLGRLPASDLRPGLLTAATLVAGGGGDGRGEVLARGGVGGYLGGGQGEAGVVHPDRGGEHHPVHGPGRGQ